MKTRNQITKIPKALIAVLALMICAGLMASCGGGTKTPAAGGGDASGQPLAGKKIGVTLWYKGDEWCVGIDSELKKQGAALGAEMIVQDPNGIPEAQKAHLDNFAAQKVDMIIFDCVDPPGVGSTLDEISAKGIPIIGFDEPPEWDGLVSFIAWDNYQTGLELGKYIRKYIDEKNDGKGEIVIYTLLQSPLVQDRVRGFKEGLGELTPDIKIVSEQDPEQIEEKAYNMTMNIKEPFNIIFGNSDPVAFGAVSALETMGAPDNIKVFSCGGYGDKSYNLFVDENPYYEAVVVIPPELVIKTVMETAVAYFEGKSVEKLINCPFVIADHSDYSSLAPY